ncbi:MAG TPA: hypothetical protein VF718_12065 [Allosphingosinicella sp.]
MPSNPASTNKIEPDIVVTGHRANADEDLSDVRSIAIVGNEPMGRFEAEVCPRVIGLPADYASVVETRIRQVAEAVGPRVANGGCEPNLTVIVAEDGAAALASLRKKRPLLFAAMTNAEVLRLRRSRGPVWNWYSVDQKRSDGGSVEHVTMVSFDGAPPQPISPHAYIASNVSMSRLTTPVRLDITLAFIILEKRYLEGLTLAQVADFSAMLGLSMINYERVASLKRPSILQIFSQGRADVATTFDLAFLKGLYSNEAGLPSTRRTARIAGSLTSTAASPQFTDLQDAASGSLVGLVGDQAPSGGKTDSRSGRPREMFR